MGRHCENCGRPIPKCGKYGPYCGERCKEEADARFNEKLRVFKAKKVTFGMRLLGGLVGIILNALIAFAVIYIYSLAKGDDPETYLSFYDFIVKIGVKPVLIGMAVVLFITGFLFPKVYLNSKFWQRGFLPDCLRTHPE